MRRLTKFALIAVVSSVMVFPSSTLASPDCWGKVPSITGTGEDDVLAGRRFFDVIHGLGGDDFIFGDGIGAGPSSGLFDSLCGGAGADFIAGGGGDDKIRGHGGDDVVYGEDGGDTLRGGGGDDLIYDGIGVDVINGGDGYDIWMKCLDGTVEASVTGIETTVVSSCVAPVSGWH